jgi:hypothetical protein
VTCPSDSGKAALSDCVGCGIEFVVRSPEVDVRAEQCPIRTGLTLVRHSYAAGVDDSGLAMAPVELHVRVAADDDRLADAGSH